MSSAPPLASAYISRSDDRIRRNVACVNCRNSKVRCRPHSVPGRPCQRCDKSGGSCVVDKSHKRITRRSKLELLEKELESIKEAVHTSARPADASWSPSSPRREVSLQVDTHSPARGLPEATSATTSSTQHETPFTSLGSGISPTEPRTLGQHVVTAMDIDWYFDCFFQHFHPILPIIHKKHPNEAHAASPILFWVIVYIACRRYCRDESLFVSLLQHIDKSIWPTVSHPIISLAEIQALLLICAWPLPTMRLVSDSSPTVTAMAMRSCLVSGYHTGAGMHNQFCVGSRREVTAATDEEASSAWVACCMLAQSAATYTGQPPPSIQFPDQRCRDVLTSSVYSDMLSIYDVQKFLNRFHTAMNVHISSNGSVPDMVVSSWEDDFDALKAHLVQHNTDLSRIILLSAHLEIQLYNLCVSSPSPQHARLTRARLLTTARNLINTAQDLEARAKLLTHAPHWIFRAIMDSACVLVTVMHSTSPLSEVKLTTEESNDLGQTACDVVLACSTREGDLPHRGGVVVETYWTVRHLLPRVPGMPSMWAHRLGAGHTYWALARFKEGLLEAKSSTDVVNRGIEVMQSRRVDTIKEDVEDPAALLVASDPFQDIDWSLFMDDFNWADSGAMYMGLPVP